MPDLQKALKCITMKSKRKNAQGKRYYGFYAEDREQGWPCKAADEYATGMLLKKFREVEKYPLTKSLRAYQPAVTKKVTGYLNKWGYKAQDMDTADVMKIVEQAVEKDKDASEIKDVLEEAAAEEDAAYKEVEKTEKAADLANAEHEKAVENLSAIEQTATAIATEILKPTVTTGVVQEEGAAGGRRRNSRRNSRRSSRPNLRRKRNTRR